MMVNEALPPPGKGEVRVFVADGVAIDKGGGGGPADFIKPKGLPAAIPTPAQPKPKEKVSDSGSGILAPSENEKRIDANVPKGKIPITLYVDSKEELMKIMNKAEGIYKDFKVSLLIRVEMISAAKDEEQASASAFKYLTEKLSKHANNIEFVDDFVGPA